LSACVIKPPAVGTIVTDHSAPAPASGESMAQPGPSSAAAYGAGEDQHWFQPDDYLISEQPYREGWIYVYLAKMKTAPSGQTKSEAQFFNLRESKDQWTAHYWKTRPAQASDLTVGNFAICFEANHHDNLYDTPLAKEDARTGNWFAGRITDVSDLYKNSVRLDTYNCTPAALRVPIQ
jgi:hypothetical protein